VIDDTAGLATPDEMAAINAFDDRLQADGHWVFAGGLAAPSSATVIDNRGSGEAMFTDGPFLESKEYLAGFWILEAPDLDVALNLAAEGSKACNRKSRCGRSCERGRRPGGDQPGPPRGVGPGGRLPDHAFW
jgi:hypothetical protein